MAAAVMEHLSGVAPQTKRELRGRVSSPPTVDRWAILAGLRFFLALTVVGNHLRFVIDEQSPWWQPISRYNAFASVMAFLLISGYSIAHSYSRQPAGFYGRRFWRIYPVYLFCLGLCAISFLPDWKGFAVLGGNAELPERIAWLNHAFFGQGFWSGGMFCFAPSWSLSIEVCFYLLTPLFARCRSSILIGLILVSAAMHFVCGVYNLDPVGGRRYGFPALVVCWAWLAGFVYYRHSTSRGAKSMLFALPAMLAAGPSTVATACGLLFWNRVRLSAWQRACLHFSGDISYPLYLVHFPVFLLIFRHFHCSAAWVYVVASLLAACVLHLLLESPIRWLRHRWGHAY